MVEDLDDSTGTYGNSPLSLYFDLYSRNPWGGYREAAPRLLCTFYCALSGAAWVGYGMHLT